MRVPAVLIVEDNAATRKMIRLVVEGEGFASLEAATAAAGLEKMAASSAVQLVVMDLLLPDLGGLELAARLRALPGGAETPIVALSSFSALLESARERPEMFDAFLFKPVVSERLVEILRTYLLPGVRAMPDASERLPSGHVLVVDDDPVQLKLTRIHLAGRVAKITTAGSGAEALAELRRSRADLVLSDVLMPGMDGFELCMALRQDPALADIPVLLVSAHYADPADDELARRVGASALLPRKPDYGEIIASVGTILDRRAEADLAPAPEPSEQLHRDHVSRARLQLERQLALNVGQAQRAALQGAQLTILSGVADALTRCTDVDAGLDEVLAACLDAAGIQRGVLYRTTEKRSGQVTHAVGFADEQRPLLEGVFGHAGLLTRAVREGVLFPVVAPPLSQSEVSDFLAKAGVASAFFVPLVGGGHCVGALLLGSSAPAPEPLQLTFCRALGAYIGQALVLADTFAGERAARRAAEEASRAKTSFLSLVSHELLTPLTSIRLQLDRLLLPGREIVSERQGHMLGLISNAEDRLRDLVNTLLEYTRVESGRLEITPELVDVGGLLRELVETLRPRAQKKGIALEIDSQAIPPARFLTDARLLRLIASNLIDNAIKFTDAGHVRASIETEGRLLRLEVTDTGRGIPPEAQTRIFDPFEQLEKARNKHTPGFGLGLAVVKRVTEALGGSLELSSQVGAGTRFVVITPELVHARTIGLEVLPPASAAVR